MRLDLPHRIPVLNSVIQVKTLQAIELIRNNEAREVFVNGEFIGIEIRHFGPKPAELDKSPLPPVELPGIRFQDPRAGANYHRFVLSIQ